MKMSPKQAFILAKEIVRQLQETNVFKVSDVMMEKLNVFIAKRDELDQARDNISREIDKHDNTFQKIIGKKIKGLYGSEELSTIVRKVEDAYLPTVETIEAEIILKAMFTTEADMQKFVDAILKKYSKAKILSH